MNKQQWSASLLSHGFYLFNIDKFSNLVIDDQIFADIR